jgi:amino acid transporter
MGELENMPIGNSLVCTNQYQNYAMQWLVVLPLEIIAASITINFWDTTGKYDHAIFVSVFLFVIVLINMFGVKGYGEAEFFFSIVKVIAVIGYM